ncbi:protein-L-isoaspartate O-methyltransferase family protein [Acetobacter oryzifermentans]|nr:protein-L-isoaspartate O-methyltransferase [Acetobacter oryzifermentans]
MTLQAAIQQNSYPMPYPKDKDMETARNLMVDDQLRPSEITNLSLLSVMRELPRECCVMPDQQSVAYADMTLSLGQGRVLPQPLLTARLVQAVMPVEKARVLVVGAATGYTAALFAALGADVTALESNTHLAEQGQHFCQQESLNVSWVIAPLSEGITGNTPYDVIYFDGAILRFPAFCAAQLATSGIMAGVMTTPNRLAEAFTARREPESASSFIVTNLFETQLPLLPDLAAPVTFEF